MAIEEKGEETDKYRKTSISGRWKERTKVEDGRVKGKKKRSVHVKLREGK